MADHYFAQINADGTLFALLVRPEDAGAPPLEAGDPELVTLSQPLFEQWRANRDTRRWQDGELVDYTPPPPPARPYVVSKLTVVNRLAAAGKLRIAYGALKLDAPLAEVTDDELHLRERWNAAAELGNTDQTVRLFLQQIGADVDAILAPEPTA